MSDGPVYPPANPEDDLGTSVARLCDAIRLFLHAHYEEEIRERGGLGFIELVFNELLAMCVAVQTLQAEDPPRAFAARIDERAKLLADRVGRYLEEHAPKPDPTPTAEADPGQPPLPDLPSRLM